MESAADFLHRRLKEMKEQDKQQGRRTWNTNNIPMLMDEYADTKVKNVSSNSCVSGSLPSIQFAEWIAENRYHRFEIPETVGTEKVEYRWTDSEYMEELTIEELYERWQRQ